jgi:hypothetical protein
MRTPGLLALGAPRHNAVMAEDPGHEELRSAIEARRELGAEMEPAIVEAFVGRIEQRLAERAEHSERALQRRRDHQKEMVLGSMGISVPIFVIAAVFTGLPGVIAVCVALVAIAVVTGRG